MDFQRRAGAVRFLEEFKKRLAKFGLELHPDRTRLIEFGRYAARGRNQRGEGKPETFTVLGFTHYCGRRHKTETFTVWRITAKMRMAAKLKGIKVELQRRKHDRTSQVVEQPIQMQEAQKDTTWKARALKISSIQPRRCSPRPRRRCDVPSPDSKM